MRWQYIPGDPDSTEITGDQDRIVLTDLEGDDDALAYVGQLALFFSGENLRTGYDVKLEGSCNKGPQGINWGPFSISFEHNPHGELLKAHLEAEWGPQGEDLRVDMPGGEAADAKAYL